MSKKRHTRALYEVIQANAKRSAGGIVTTEPKPAPPPVEAPEPPPPPPPAPPMSGGRTIRVPFGYVLVALGGALILLLVAYSVGYGRGKAAVIGASGAADENAGESSQLPIFDPTDEQRPPDERTAREQASPDPSERNVRVAPDRGSAREAPDLYEDTRESGLNYILVRQADQAEAERVATFLVDNGVDAMVIPYKNLWQVWTRRGFDSWYSNPDAQRFFDRIKALGRQWKAGPNGVRDFDDAYPVKYRDG